MSSGESDPGPVDCALPWQRRRVLAKEKIAENEAALRAMQQDIRMLQSKRYELFEDFNNTSRIMALLSPEILSDIFIAACMPSDVDFSSVPTQFVIGRVCKSWRRIAWSTPRLWSIVSIRLVESRYNTQRVLLEDWLRRSGDCPLFISLHLEEDAEWEPPVDSTLENLMSTCHRWAKLDASAYPGLMETLQKRLPQLPLLKVLELSKLDSVEEDYLSTWKFSSTVLRLHTLHVYAFLLDPQLGIHWGSLVELHATISFQFEPSLEILAQLSSLLHLQCTLKDPKEDFTSDDIPSPSLLSLQTLSVDGPMELIISFLELIKTPKLNKLTIEFDETSDGIVWTTSIRDFVQRCSCPLVELEVTQCDQNNITDEGNMLDMLLKMPPSLKLFDLWCDGSFLTLSNRIIHRLNLMKARVEKRRPCLPNLETFNYRGNISFTLSAMAEMLRSRQRPLQAQNTTKTCRKDGEADKPQGASVSQSKQTDTLNKINPPSEVFFNVTYLNSKWFQKKDPNEMWRFYKQVADFNTRGVSLSLDWEKPQPNGEGSD